MERKKEHSELARDKRPDQEPLLMKFFTEELQDIYWAEKHLMKALPMMASKSTTDELLEAFSDHLAETEEHVIRLENIFEMLGIPGRTKKCEAMAGILKEGEEIVFDTREDSMTRDVGLIFAAQKAEHYEIASYGCLVTLAKTLGIPDIAEILILTLQEEKAADERLSGIAEAYVNVQASDE